LKTDRQLPVKSSTWSGTKINEHEKVDERRKSKVDDPDNDTAVAL